MFLCLDLGHTACKYIFLNADFVQNFSMSEIQNLMDGDAKSINYNEYADKHYPDLFKNIFENKILNKKLNIYISCVGGENGLQARIQKFKNLKNDANLKNTQEKPLFLEDLWSYLNLNSNKKNKKNKKNNKNLKIIFIDAEDVAKQANIKMDYQIKQIGIDRLLAFDAACYLAREQFLINSNLKSENNILISVFGLGTASTIDVGYINLNQILNQSHFFGGVILANALAGLDDLAAKTKLPIYEAVQEIIDSNLKPDINSNINSGLNFSIANNTIDAIAHGFLESQKAIVQSFLKQHRLYFENYLNNINNISNISNISNVNKHVIYFTGGVSNLLYSYLEKEVNLKNNLENNLNESESFLMNINHVDNMVLLGLILYIWRRGRDSNPR